MFKKEGENEIETIIGPSVQVEGSFVSSGDMIIEGTVSGSIKTESNLRVGKDAKIIADITAANAVIAGEVQGEVRIKDNLELTATAKIFGDVKTKLIKIDEGAVLQGRLSAGEDRKSKVEKIEDREKQHKAKEKAPEALV